MGTWHPGGGCNRKEMNFNFLIYVLITLSLQYLHNCEAGNDILGCGGFVKSEVGINYSRVEIKLYTKQGSLKYQTDCAPNNGYYFIPLYDKGDYVLKVEPPSGWSFEPTSVSLHVDGSNDACSIGQDINFIFKGFFVSGKVVSKGSSEGPAGVDINLLSRDGEVVKETRSSTGGLYTFSQVLPSRYTIRAKHPKWKMENDKLDVAIAQDNEVVADSFVVGGYDVNGAVQSEGEPIRGVHFLLFARGRAPKHPVQDIWGCRRSAVKGFVSSSDKDASYLCHVTSNEDGLFSFDALPPGDYRLIPFYKGEHIEFDVLPSSLDFSVKHGSFAFGEKFQVQGFSVSGKVFLSPSGTAVSEAKIFLDEKHRATTNTHGVYHLENMKTGSYKLQVVAANVYFDPIIAKITPNTPHLPDIVASKFDVCGRIVTVHRDFVPGGRTLLLSSSGDKEQRTLITNKDGEFCIDLGLGQYHFVPYVSEVERSSGLRFLPSEKKVVVIKKPILNVLFTQFTANVNGRIQCLEKCDGLELNLESFAKNGDNSDVVSVTNGKFSVANLLPGTYYLSVNKPEWCWKKSSIEFAVNDGDVTNLSLQQTGYNIPIASSHAVDIEVTPPGGNKKFMLKAEAGTSMHCLPFAGVYTLKPLGCHVFQEKILLFDTSSSGVVSLVAEKHTVTGKVLTETNVTDVVLLIKKAGKDGESETERIELNSKPAKEGNLYKWLFAVHVQPYSTVTVEPSSGHMLFRPSVQEVKVLDECIQDAFSFNGRDGLFIHGSIDPVLAGVKIAVQIDVENGTRVVAKTETDSSGKYVVGPLNNELRYDVVAEKEGHVFEKTTKMGHFKALKLAEVFVDVASDAKEPLAGVLVSLSGGTDYRKNMVTLKDGRLQFIGLSPGQYFLRPVMKEYQFDPPSKMLTVAEGATVEVVVRGKRVAFSCFGVVNSLTGEVEAGLLIEAVGIGSQNCEQYQEEAISEPDGTFRIRGLQPECDYRIRLKEGVDENSHIERVSPSMRAVKVNSGDVTNVRLIVFRYFKQTDISGYVITSQDYMNTLKVRLFRDDSPDQALHTLSLGQSNFFHLPILPLDNKNYLLKLDTTLSSSTYQFELPAVSFRANTTYRHFTFEFKPYPRSSDPEMTQGSLLVLPLVLVISLLLFNYNKVLPLFGQLMEVVQAVVNPARNLGGNGEPTNGDGQNVRRKIKPRRLQ